VSETGRDRVSAIFDCRYHLVLAPAARNIAARVARIANTRFILGVNPFYGIFLDPLRRGIHPLRSGLERSARSRSPMRFSTGTAFVRLLARHHQRRFSQFPAWRSIV